LPGLVIFIGAVHQEIERRRECSQAAEQLPAVLGVGGLARREREGYCRSSICGNQMNLGGPSAA
jgi:hypothetical protein